MLTAAEVEALLLDRFATGGYANWDEWSDLAAYGEKTTDALGLGPVKVWEHDFGGIETNISYLMFQIGDRTFRKEGLWVSHDGQYWNGPFDEVKAVQKVITDYDPV
jgi:hypothetical protein